jgi:hypothetical protein
MLLSLLTRILIATLIAIVAANTSNAGNFSGQPQPSRSDQSLMDLSIEELMNIEVTTASRQAQKLSQTSSAVCDYSGRYPTLWRNQHTRCTENGAGC